MKNDLLIEQYESEIKRLKEEILKYKYDNLTRLPLRSDFIQHMDNLLNEVKMFHRHFIFIMIDVNDLKKINTDFGYVYGDAYIKRVANDLISTFNEYNIYRIGGDEFCMVKVGNNISQTVGKLNELSNISYGVVESKKIKHSHLDTKKMIEIADRIIKRKKRKIKKRKSDV